MNRAIPNNRRQFLKKATAFGAAAAFAPSLIAEASSGSGQSKEGDGIRFLFQGDSITDGNRSRNNDWNHVMGHGYQYIISSELWCDHPAKHFHFFNRGISGNKVTDLAARWQKDTLDLKPDVLSILIGINDVSAFIKGDETFSSGRFENDYAKLLRETQQALPGIQQVLCEPFVLPVGRVMPEWESYSSEVKKRQAVVQQLSKSFNAVFVPFQNMFDKALAKAPADYWIWDGIHPMPAGHALMAREWKRCVGHRLRFIR